jgi:tetratricopeptide (TPR) repeat protein
MKPLHYVVFGLVIIAGLAGSILLIPSESDLGLMYFRGRQYDDARPLLEKRLAAGDRSVDVLVQLAEIYVQDGSVERAVALLRQLQTSGPDRLALFQRVAEFQKYNEQTQDYLHTLETIERIAGSEDGLRELANQYRYNNDSAKLIPALQTLVARYKAEPEEYLELANLLAGDARFAEAAGILQRFEARHPAEISAESAELFVAVLLDGGQPARALDRAARWLRQHRDPDSIVRFVALLRSRGSNDLAARLLAPFDSAVDGDPALFSEWLRIEAAAGRAGEAFDRIERLRKTKPLTEDLIGSYIDLTLAQGRLNSAVEAAERFGLTRLDDALLAMLAESAFSSGQPSVASRLVLAAGSRFADGHPLLAARLAFARGDWPGTTASLMLAERQSSLSNSDRLAIVTLDQSLGRRLEAAAQLSRIDLNSARDDELLETARLYITVGNATEGARRFDELRAGRSRFAADEAWALVAAASDRGDEVIRWLHATRPKSVSGAILQDLAFTSLDGTPAPDRQRLAVAAAERLFAENPENANRLLLARALNEAGRPAEALPHLRVLRGGTPEAEELYAAALLGAVRSPGATTMPNTLKKELHSFLMQKLDQKGGDESAQLAIIENLLEIGEWESALPRLEPLARRREDVASLYIETAVRAGNLKAAVDFLKSELARADLPVETREARVYALIDHGGQEEALPYIRQMAELGRSAWPSAYEEALEKLGRKDELLQFWRDRLENPATMPDEKRGIAYRLIDEGKAESARAVFGWLAATEPPDHADVAEWLFLWGSSPSRDTLDALENRARRARAEERIGWLNRLMDAGAPDRVVAMVSADPPATGSGGALFDVYIRALAARNDSAALSSAIAEETAAIANPDRVRQLATVARESGGLTTAVPAYQRLAKLVPTDRDALHWLGVFEYSRARYSSAKRWFAPLLAVSQGAYEDNSDFADILWRAGARSKARVYYGQALRQIERIESPSVEARVAHAQALYRLGYTQRAVQDYRRLVADQPRNGDLRADFAAMLLDATKYDEADDVLSGGLDSGVPRVALLRAQLLSATGRMPEAMDLMRRLIGQDSISASSAGVAAMFAALSQSSGQDRLAQEIVTRALAKDPDNEDLRAALAEVRKARADRFDVETEWRRIQGLQKEDIVRVTAQSLLSKALRALFSVEQDRVSITSLQRSDGTTGAFDGTVRRAEAALEWEAESGTKIKGSLFGGDSSLGGGIALTQPDLRGSTGATLEIARPNWDFTQLLAQGGTRDRLEVKRDTTIDSRVTTEFGAAVNRYDLPGAPDAAESVSASGNVNLTLLRKPQLSLNYSLDAEYRTSIKNLPDSNGNIFRPLPLVSREVHTGTVQGDKQLARGLHAAGAAGIAVDRFGGHAPYFAGSLTYDPQKHLGLHAEYDHQLYSYGSRRTTTTLRGGLFWMF